MSILVSVALWVSSFCSPTMIEQPCYCPDPNLQASVPCECGRAMKEMNDCGNCFMSHSDCGEECEWYLLAY
jgi:hypothetical protein